MKRVFSQSKNLFAKTKNVSKKSKGGFSNPWEHITKFTTGLLPQTETVTLETLPKFLTFNLACDGRGLIKDAKLLQVDFNTSDGRVGILPGSFMEIYKITPGVLEVRFLFLFFLVKVPEW
jgi:hypothetical protein